MFLLQTMLIAGSSQMDYMQNLTKLLSDFVLTCGSSEGFCNKSQSPLQIEPTVIPNCAEWLECGSNCALDYSCAPDAKFAYIDVSCISTDIYPLRVDYSSHSYNMITKCGIFSSNNDGGTSNADALCTELPERTMTNLHDDVFRPVIASDSLITYRNAHCARCNSEADIDIIPFELQVECQGQFEINSFKHLQDAWKAIYEHNCSVSYIPPYEYIWDVKSCPTQENMISHCNATGLWSKEEYDPQIEWACEHFKSLEYKLHYKNIYCYICNPTLVSKYHSEPISSCNVTGEIDFLDDTIEHGCTTFPVMPRMGPFKNVFCKQCNEVLTKFYYDERYFDDVGLTVTTESVYHTNHLNVAETVYTKYRLPRFDSIVTMDDTAGEYVNEGHVSHFNDALIELGKICGYENLCDKPYKSEYSHFGRICNFPCLENSNCCRTLSLGIDPGTFIVTDLSVSIAELETAYNETDSIKQQSNTTGKMYSHLPGIDGCDREIALNNNVSMNWQTKCEYPRHADILEYIPVTSLDTKIDYRNVYCARCNGESGILHAYEFTTDCGTVLEAGAAVSFANVNDIIRKENCKIKIEMPYNRCEYLKCVHTCPTNDLDSVYPDDIRYLCERADLMTAMFTYVEVNNTLYKNVFCFLCHVQWNDSVGKETIIQCNETGLWDYKGNTSMKALQCENTAFHPAWLPLGYKNIFCAECNMQLSEFETFFDGMSGGGKDCTGIGCLFKESAYRRAFSISVSPPSGYPTTEDIDGDAIDFCATGKTIVGDVCRPVIENTVDLRYGLTFGLRIIESASEKDITVLRLLETVRQQVIEQIQFDVYDGLQFTSVTVSGIGPCVDILTNENFTKLETINTTDDYFILVEADIIVDYTKNRSRLENNLINVRNNWTFVVRVETGYIIFTSHAHNLKSGCHKYGIKQTNKGCTISESDGYTEFVDRLNQLTVNKLLECVLQKLPLDDEIIVEGLCSKGILFHSDTDKGSMVACKSDLLQLNYTTEKSTPTTRHSVSALSVKHAIFSFVCTCFSLLCLALTFLTYSLFKCIRTLPGINNMNLTLTLFGAQIFTQFGLWLTEHEARCIILGIITHYMWLCTFCAMNICSFHMFKVFTSLMYTSQNQSKWVIVKYCLYVYVMPVFVILIYIVVKVSVDGSQRLGYGGSVCFLSELVPIVAVLVLPAVAIIIANFVFSILAYRHIRCSPHVQSNLDRNDFKIYVKLLTVTGVAWPLMFIDSVLPLTAFSFIATFANALQGVFIFIAFICNKKVLGLYKNFIGKGHPYSVAGDSGDRHKKSSSETAM